MAVDGACSFKAAASGSRRQLVSFFLHLEFSLCNGIDFYGFRSEWHDLFYAVHSVCLWDEKGAQKIRDSLEDLIVAFIKQAQSRVLVAGEEQALLKAYIIEWRKFFTQSSFLPLPFWQLETSLQVSLSSVYSLPY